ncbi:4-hydroxy-tetrahydrodipicolinate synthase [Basfia succiniciproducens]|uniref:4-hydroxy-tetrahydrodipicolinate synthase n=1 Tax=Basfia succiniciproducens TaxID=653940 RepID=A0A1G5CRQ3_9PAST|nr:4-hydroxy-tetrahydrodipicolinate synthase [Basfia succiniciproducens]QIM69543.1 4-hydroxy-tetrahydrodipicolinate synthase [Basfia succiniciproducens]SCY05133.1 4-hydroxy-tetrahydrodipicolinate synthase [Basfia succiniciproducens]
MFKPQGVIAPVLTALDENEKFNPEAYSEFIDYLINAGIHGIFPLGTNGEFYAFDQTEKLEIIKTAIKAVNGRVPVYAGTGCVTTKETIEFSKKVVDLGVDVLSVISPYFVSVSQDDLYRHFSSVAKNVNVPILMYNIPARSGNNIDYKTVKKLAEENNNIIGIKDSSGNFDNTLKYIENTVSDINVMAGSDSLILWTLLAGGTGAISGCSNVFPELMVSIYEYWKQGDFEKANEAQKKIRAFRNVMQMGNPNSVVKRAALLRGHNVGPAREPSNCANAVIDQALQDVFKFYD